MSATLSLFTGPAGSSFDGSTFDQKIQRIYFKVVAAGNYAGTPGDPLDFTTLGDIVKSQYAPLWVIMSSSNPAGDSGYVYEYTPAANPTLSNGFFQVLKGNGVGPFVDIGAGAYPAGVTGDTIIGYADFIKL